ncbi:MAG: carboxypeptidase-like regulatory domain-containing protein [Saprospiraceae bacterium]|nr:carboxypeptidase-like regulatory domain-containing protein [Saprospiraceae bacterium]
MPVKFIVFLFLCLTTLSVKAQRDYSGPIQLSGMVITQEKGQPVKMPYVTIAVEGTSRGTYTNWDGFFSIVVERGETLVFSYVGYKTVKYIVPDTLSTNRYSIFQIMTFDNILLPETVIYPWPDKDNYHAEFLAMDVNSDISNRIQENLSKRVMASLYDKVPVDGNESTQSYMRQNAATYYYQGQTKPIQLMNVMAWKQFLEAWKSGKFKKKKKEE